MTSFKSHIRRVLSGCGWFLRKVDGLPAGVSLEHDLLVTAAITAPRVILDVGAHRGETTERFRFAFPGARIHSLEPVISNFAVLANRSRSWPGVTCHRLALSDHTGEVEIVLQRDSQTHSLETPVDDRHGPSQQVERIQVTTLDAFAAAHALDVIDVLKLDTEGHELSVLRGAHDFLVKGRVRTILIEASLDPADRVHTSLSAASSLLRPFGFELAAMYDQVMWRDPTRLAYFNALFVLNVARTDPERAVE